VSYTQEREQSGEGELINLSGGGCAVRNTSGIPVTDPMYITLRIAIDPQSPPVLIEMGKVRWSSPTDFGVEFLIVPSKDLDRLQRFLRTVTVSPSAA
jgi:hypothetical protein